MNARSQSPRVTLYIWSKVFAAMRFQTALVAVLLACSSTEASPLNLVHHSADKKGAVASENEICTQIGIELIKRGVSITSFGYS